MSINTVENSAGQLKLTALCIQSRETGQRHNVFVYMRHSADGQVRLDIPVDNMAP